MTLKPITSLLTLSLLAFTACQDKSSSGAAADRFELDESQKFIRTGSFTSLSAYDAAALKSGGKYQHGQRLSIAGREDILMVDGILNPSRYFCETESASSKPLTEQITDIIGDSRIVIINENHSIAQHRATIQSLLLPLKNLGFDYYAAETFSPFIGSIEDNFATAKMGFYSSEPMFGRLITEALRQDFTLVPYEQTQDQFAPDGARGQELIRARETAQSENLAAYLEKIPKTAKILIHVGHSHVAERPIAFRNGSGETEWMAYRLKKLTGIDPITISQTACGARGEAIIFGTSKVDKDGKADALHTDYVIGYPAPKTTEGRPHWRKEMGDKEVSIPTNLLSSDAPRLYEARHKDAPDGAVPIDRLLIRADESPLPLLLPPGDYRLDTFSETGRAEDPVAITVP